MSFGIGPWEMKHVALHYQEERRVLLIAQHEARIHKMNEALKNGAQNVEIFLPEF